MFKAIIKEIAIIILLIVAIGLVFFVVFYDYNTINTTIPKKVEAYELSSETRDELEETLKAQNTQELVKTYILDETDLSGYESKKTYEKGKPNPFSKYTEVSSSGNSSGNNTGNNNTSGNNNSSGGDSGKFSNSVNGK